MQTIISYMRQPNIVACYNDPDWSNDAENSALTTAINYILIDIHIENSHFKL